MTTSDHRPSRVTMRQLAAELGVSHVAVSFALNGKAGVSEATRARIVDAARARGWQPNHAARALAGLGTGSIGLVLTRDADELARDSFYLRFIAGIQSVLSPKRFTLTFQIAETLEQEIELYHSWAAQERVDGLIVVDPRHDDLRVPVLVALGMPSVVVGGREHSADGVAVVVADDMSPMTELVRTLVALGHQRIAYLAGPATFAHAVTRAHAYRTAMSVAGLAAMEVIHTPYQPEDVAQKWRTMSRQHPTAVIADNDQLAFSVLKQAREDDLEVPAAMTIVSWEDSPLCEATTPPLAALWRDPFALGHRAAVSILAELSEHAAERSEVEPAVLRMRGSMGPAPSSPAP